MISKRLLSMALLVPFLIVGIVWSMASILLFQTPPAEAVAADPLNPRISTTLKQHVSGCSYNQGRQNNFGQLMGYRPGVAPAPVQARQLSANFGMGSTKNMSDYLDAIDKDGSFKWSVDKLPIKVYIDDGSGVPGYRPQFKQMIADSFDAWCQSSDGLLSWRAVSNPRQADVVCTWTDEANFKPGAVEAGNTRTLVQQNRDTGEGRIVTAQISILTQLMGRGFSDENMQKTCLHEVGHALGLQGHSDVPSDIMFPTVNETQVAQLKPRDINTMTRLYTENNFTASAAPSQSYGGGGNWGRRGGIMAQRGGGFNQFNGGNGFDPSQNGYGNGDGGYIPSPRHRRWGWDRQSAIRDNLRRDVNPDQYYN